MTSAEQDGAPWDAEDLVPARQVPHLAVVASHFGEWYPLTALIVVFALYGDLPARCDRLTIVTNGLEIRGVLLRRTYTWPTIRKLSVRRYQLTAELDRFGTKHWRFNTPSR